MAVDRKVGKRAMARQMNKMSETGSKLYADNVQKSQALVWAVEQFQGLLLRFPVIRDDSDSKELVQWMDSMAPQVAAIRERRQKEAVINEIRKQQEIQDGAAKTGHNTEAGNGQAGEAVHAPDHLASPHD